MKDLVLTLVTLAAVVTASAASAQTTAPAGASDLPVSVGPEVAIAADGPGGNSRGTPAVAFGRDAYLVVWREGWEGKNGGARIRAARVGLDGTVLDQPSIELAPNSDRDSPQERPRVAFCKDTYLVVWHDLRNGTDYDVLAARVSADGRLLDREPITIAAGRHNQTLPDVASDGEVFVVVWQGFEEADRAFHGYSAWIGRDGVVSAPVKVDVAPCLRVAFDGTHFLVACGSRGFWQTGDVQRLDRLGRPLPKEKPFRAAQRVGLYSLSAVPGKGWLLVTHRSQPDAWGWGGPGAMRCYFILSDGRMDPSMPKETGYPGYDKLDPNWLDGATRDRANWPYGLSAAAWDGRQSVVVWPRYHCVGEKKSMLANGDIMLSRTDGWKRQADVPIVVAASEAEELEPALASDGAGRLLCVYEKEVGPKTLICARTIESR